MFIVMETSYAYNDEIYHGHEEDGGMPKRAFETRMQAEDVCRQLNIEKTMDAIGRAYPNVAHYCYDICDITRDGIGFDELKNRVKEICGKELGGDEYEIGLDTEGLTSEQKKQIAGLFNLSFYFVAECE